jgi:hypothetical protein
VAKIERELSDQQASGRHQYVCDTAKLCAQAIGHARRGAYEKAASSVWDDEAVEVSRSGAHLADNSCRLLADIVLELNMNEKNRWDGVGHEKTEAGWKVTDDIDRVGTSNELPPCLGVKGKRDLILADSDQCECDFHLCPYDPDAAYGHAHRGLSEAFCRHQRRLARRRSHARLRWRRDIPVTTLEGFWAQMEQPTPKLDAYARRTTGYAPRSPQIEFEVIEVVVETSGSG